MRLGLILSLSLALSSCGASQSTGSSNLVCAFVEGYLQDKALALSSVAQGGSAAEAIEATIGGLSGQIPKDSEARPAFDTFLNAMSMWGAQVDIAYQSGDSAGITSAAATLEEKIDSAASQCEAMGWKFEQGWR